MAQPVNVLAEYDGLSSIPKTHLVGKNQFLQVAPHTHTHHGASFSQHVKFNF